MNDSLVYLVEYIYWDSYELLAVYDNKEAAIDHVADPNFRKQHGTKYIHIREVGVRSRKQLEEIHSQSIYDRK